ncbi:hypothetical protein N9F76_00690 [bacterium]|nr:hypothetical protein [bacterium]
MAKCPHIETDILKDTQKVEVLATQAALKRIEELSVSKGHGLFSNFVLSRAQLFGRPQYLLHYSNAQRDALTAGKVRTAPNQMALRELLQQSRLSNQDELSLVLLPATVRASRSLLGAIIDSNRLFCVDRIASSALAAGMPTFERRMESRRAEPDPMLAVSYPAKFPTIRFHESFSGYRLAVVGQFPAAKTAVQELFRAGIRDLALVGEKIPIAPRRDESGKQVSLPGVHRNPQIHPSRINAAFRANILTPRSQAERDQALSFSKCIFSYTTLAALKHVDAVFCVTNSVPARIATAAICAAYLKPLTQISSLPHQRSMSEGFTTKESLGPDYQVDIRIAVPGSVCMNCLGGVPEIDTDWFDQFQDHGYVSSAHGGPNSVLNWPVSFRGDVLKDAVSFTADALRPENSISCRFLSAGHVGWDRQREQKMPSASEACPICRLTGVGDRVPNRFFRLVRDLSYWQFKHLNPQARNA